MSTLRSLFELRGIYAFLALLISGSLWVFWFAGLMTGQGNTDKYQQVIGTDYLQFYAAAHTIQGDEPQMLYDIEHQKSVQRDLVGLDFDGYFNFYAPPLWALLYVPFAVPAYAWSFFLWSCFSLLLLVVCSLLLSDNWKTSLFWSLTFLPVFANVSFGQTAFVTLILLILCLCMLRQKRLFLAGIVLSIAAFKAQLLLGIILWWLIAANQYKRALAGFFSGFILWGLLCWLILPGASASYVDLVLHVLPNLEENPGFALTKQITWHSFFLLLLGHQTPLVTILTWLCKLIAIFYSARVLKRYSGNLEICFGVAVIATFWLSPHTMIYDLALLIIPATLLSRELSDYFPRLQMQYLLIWLATLLGVQLTTLQLTHLSIAIHPSTLVIGTTSFVLVKALLKAKGTAKNCPPEV